MDTSWRVMDELTRSHTLEIDIWLDNIVPTILLHPNSKDKKLNPKYIHVFLHNSVVQSCVPAVVLNTVTPFMYIEL